jgi:predicted nucleic acid-binding protein
MRIVVDTNAVIAVALDEPEKPWLIELTEQAELAAPAVLPYEVGNALSAMVKRNRLTPDEAAQAWRVVRRIPVELLDVDVAEALELAMARGIYAYDAYVLQCAAKASCPLLTLDRAMKRAAETLKIALLEKP